MPRRPFPSRPLKPRTAPRPGRQAGMTMVELLVVAVLLGVGLLGLAALQTVTIKVAGGNRHRIAAAYVGHSVLDRIAAEGAQSYHYESSGQPVPASFVRAFTSAGTANGDIGTFTHDGTFVSSSMSDPGGTIRASWVRLAPKVAAPVAGAPQINEFIVNVSFVDGEQTKWLSMSRLVRY